MKTLDATVKQEVQYCIPLWLRDEQIALALARKDVGRIEAHPNRPERVAIVCYGPTLKDEWERIRDFDYIVTCSGSHKFLLARGIVPTWHVEVDPREHKVALLGDVHPAVTYLPASMCHPKYFDHLLAARTTDGKPDVRLWHVFENSKEAERTLPRGEWAVMGGCNVGLRAMAIARFFGFTEQHVFGMDGCEGAEVGKKHADAHPLQDGTGHSLCEYGGRTWRTTPGLLESARQTWHELDMMPDVKATFYGDSLVTAMWKDYTPKTRETPLAVAIQHPELISDTYRDLNAQLHRENLAYGVGGGKHAEVVTSLVEKTKARSVLDYGAGKGYLAKALPFPIWEYDPAVPGKDALPRAADLVVCTDVLEHIEPDKLVFVLDDLRRVVASVGYFVIHTGPAQKTLADGRNAHLIQQGEAWWRAQLAAFFDVAFLRQDGLELKVIVGKKAGKAKRKAS